MMNSSNEDKKSYVCGGGRRATVRGILRQGLLALCVTFTPRGNQTFNSSAQEGSNVGLEILQLSCDECIVPSPAARSDYHPKTIV
jgi:hypothetical protein